MLVVAAAAQIDKKDCSQLDDFLRDDFATRTIVQMARAKFDVRLDIGELKDPPVINMQGNEVFKVAVKCLGSIVDETLEKNNIDKNIPLHFTRFFPDYKFNNVEPSPVMILEEAHSIAKQQGLKYVYLGNVFGHPLENSYCYECDELLIERTGYGIELKFFQGNKCFTCGREFLIYINDHKP